ncbi:MAG: hypothetical protein AAB332_03855 [Planctomycetota bacterium]
MANKTFAIENTLFCQFENNELKIILEDWAAQNRINIYYGKPSSPDIIAVPFFAAVVDKRVVGSEIWEEYLIYCKETDESKPTILLNDYSGKTISDMIGHLNRCLSNE